MIEKWLNQHISVGITYNCWLVFSLKLDRLVLPVGDEVEQVLIILFLQDLGVLHFWQLLAHISLAWIKCWYYLKNFLFFIIYFKINTSFLIWSVHRWGAVEWVCVMVTFSTSIRKVSRNYWYVFAVVVVVYISLGDRLILLIYKRSNLEIRFIRLVLIWGITIN